MSDDDAQSSDDNNRPTLDDVDASTALRIYDAQFEGCFDVDAEQDPRPCISFYLMTEFGIARLCSSFQDGFGNEAHRLVIPNRGYIPDRCHKRIEKKSNKETFTLVDANPLPDQHNPKGEDPITGLSLEITAFGFDIKPWAERECVRCGYPLDATAADRSPDGWIHKECNPSNWDDADLTAFAGGDA